MSSGTSDGYAIQYFKEVKIQHSKKRISSALIRIQFAPSIESLLGISEYFFNWLLCIQSFIKPTGITFIGECQLITQINKTVINRCRREHQNFRLHTGTNNLFHQSLIAVFRCVAMGSNTITEVMRLINNHQIIVAPIQTIQVDTVGLTVVSGKVCMEQNIITQTVCSNRVIYIIALVCIPVFAKLFRAENKDRLVSVFIVFNHGKSSEGFSQTNTVCKNTSIIFFKFVDDSQNCIALEVVQQLPNLAILKPSSFVR